MNSNAFLSSPPSEASARRSAMLLVLIVGLLNYACAARVTQFGDFANAGVNYVKASELLIDEAAVSSIRANNSVLIKTRPALATQAERLSEINDHNEALRRRIQLLHDIRRHGRLLQRYFEAIASIANSRAPESAATAAEGAFASLIKLSPAIKNATIGSTPVAKLIPLVTKPVVGAFRVRILENELKERAEAIVNEIALQEAAFTAIGEVLAADLQIQLNILETEQVNSPFAGEGALPRDWAATREQILKMTGTAASTGAAAQAARALRESFQAVVENRFDRAAFHSLLEDINAMLDIAERIAAGE